MLQPRRIPELLTDCCEEEEQSRCASIMKPSPSPRRLKEQLLTPLRTMPPPISRSNLVLTTPRRVNELLHTQLLLRPATTTKVDHSAKSRPGKAVARRSLFTQSESTPQRLDRNEEREQQTAARLEAHLRQEGGFQALLQRGLPSMTTKEFVGIVNHFLLLAGLRRIQPERGNQAELVIQALQQLGCKYKLSKSLLLTPSARQSFGQLMLLFDYLLDFAAPADFKLDNEQLFDKVAEQSRQPNDNSTEQALNTELAGLEKQLKQLQIDLDSDAKEDQRLSQLREKEESLKAELASCEEQVRRQRLEFAANEEQLAKLSAELSRQRSKIRVGGKESFSDLLDTHSRLCAELRIHRRHLQELRERSQLQLLLLRRTRKERLADIEAFNVRMRDILYSSVLGVDSRLELELPLAPTLAQVEERLQILRRLHCQMKKAEQLAREGQQRREPPLIILTSLENQQTRAGRETVKVTDEFSWEEASAI